MKTFKNKVEWNFKLSMSGHGTNVKDALCAALFKTLGQVQNNEFCKTDLAAIENHEVIGIDEDSTDEEADTAKRDDWLRGFACAAALAGGSSEAKAIFREGAMNTNRKELEEAGVAEFDLERIFGK